MKGFQRFTSKLGNRILFCFGAVMLLSCVISFIFFEAQRISIFSQQELADLTSPMARNVGEFTEPLRDITDQAMIYYTALIFICISLSLIIIFLYVNPRIVHRAEELSENIDRLASGNLDVEIVPKGDDEIADMMKSLEKFRLNLIDKKRAEKDLIEVKQRLERREKRYLLTTRAARIGLWDWNPATNETYYNDEWYTMLGYIPGELPANFETFEELCHSDDFKKCMNALTEHFDSGREYKVNFRMKHKSGHWVWIMAAGKVTNWDEDGRPIRMSGIHTDITDRKKVFDELQKTRRNLEQEIQTRTLEYKEQKMIAERANKTKDEFLANMSHELRTPLNSILGISNMLSDRQDVSNDVRQDIDIIRTSSSALLGIVNDILDISKIEAGGIELEKEIFNPEDLFNTVIRQLRPLAQQKNLTLNHNSKNISGINLIGDPFRLKQVLINLIGNAIKYTEKGKVDVRVSFKENDMFAGKKTLVCEIKDTGIGITPEKLPTIFEKFTQAETTSSRRYQGTGLGLNITKRLVDLMGGDIRVHSEVDKGSTFILTVSFDKTTEQVSSKDDDHIPVPVNAPEKKKAFSKARILIAEDHEMNRLYMSKLMKNLNCGYFEFAKDGVEAFEKYQSGKWDMILMDCMMPVMNGFESTAQIRAFEDAQNEKSRMPIVAITADAMQGTRNKCLAAGMDVYVSKPLDEKTFIQVLKHWFVIKRKKAKTAQPTSKDFIDLKILKEYSDGNFDFEKELITSFCKTGSEDLQIIKDNTQKKNHKIFIEAAHKLKGSSAFVGAGELSKLCQKAQTINPDAKAAERKKIYSDIEKEFSKVLDYMRSQDYLE